MVLSSCPAAWRVHEHIRRMCCVRISHFWTWFPNKSPSLSLSLSLSLARARALSLSLALSLSHLAHDALHSGLQVKLSTCIIAFEASAHALHLQ